MGLSGIRFCRCAHTDSFWYLSTVSLVVILFLDRLNFLQVLLVLEGSCIALVEILLDLDFLELFYQSISSLFSQRL